MVRYLKYAAEDTFAIKSSIRIMTICILIIMKLTLPHGVSSGHSADVLFMRSGKPAVS